MVNRLRSIETDPHRSRRIQFRPEVDSAQKVAQPFHRLGDLFFIASQRGLGESILESESWGNPSLAPASMNSFPTAHDAERMPLGTILSFSCSRALHAAGSIARRVQASGREGGIAYRWTFRSPARPTRLEGDPAPANAGSAWSTKDADCKVVCPHSSDIIKEDHFAARLTVAEAPKTTVPEKREAEPQNRREPLGLLPGYWLLFEAPIP
jgi:hypothetical protein